MEDNIWKFNADKPTQKSAFEILKKYASKLWSETGEIISGDVLSTLEPGGQVKYVMFLIVPAMRSYTYKLIEVVQYDVINFYPVRMTLFGNAELNQITVNDILDDKLFEENLIKFINNPLTRLALSGLKTQLDIYNDYK